MVSYVAFVLSLFVPHLSFFWRLGRVVLRDNGISCISSLIDLYIFLLSLLFYPYQISLFFFILFFFFFFFYLFFFFFYFSMKFLDFLNIISPRCLFSQFGFSHFFSKHNEKIEFFPLNKPLSDPH